MTLTEFLTAQIDADERWALAATGTVWAWEATGDKDRSWAVGHVEDEDERPLSGQIEHGQGIVIDGVCESINGRAADAVHIARHDPARVLREVEAKRSIIRMYQDAVAEASPEVVEWMLAVVATECRVYGDHADYDPDWAT